VPTEWTDSEILDQLDSGYRWSGGTITYAFATSTRQIYAQQGEAAGFTSLSSSQAAAAQSALGLWDDLIVPDMQKAAAQTSFKSADIEFGMSATGVDYAHAYFPVVGSVWLNPAYDYGTDSLTAPMIGRHGFWAYVHEIGHALGLDHMGDYDGRGDWQPQSYQDSTVYSVMSYFGPSWGGGAQHGEGLVAWADWVGADGVLYSPQTPMLSDVYAIQAIYGAETTTRTGNTVYGFHTTVTDAAAAIYDFTRNAHPILTIFDSAGNDTLDLSRWKSDSVIDLAPGAFSSCNAMTNNIAIAYGCQIENAVGGYGSDSISGNALDNNLSGGDGNDIIRAMAGDDRLLGGDGDDQLAGLDGNDILSGEAGNDFLDGGAGDDRLAGGKGDDVYVVDSHGDVVREDAEAGIDTVRTALGSYRLPDNVERLQFTGADAHAGDGNGRANTIVGGNGDDRIDGAGSADVLWGLGGSDRFVFSTALGPDNVDTIADFDAGQDIICLAKAVFGGFASAGDLAPGAFGLGSAALESDDRILYDGGTGALYFDPDGSGSAAAIQFAALSTGLVLTSANFIVI
jgi:Ca2+-binding RTX toxin-like protein